MAPRRLGSGTPSPRIRPALPPGVAPPNRWWTVTVVWRVPRAGEPQAWLTDVLERVVSGRSKAHEIEGLLPWAWQAEQLVAAVHA